MLSSDEPHEDDGFVALAQLESQPVSLGSPLHSLGEDGEIENEEA